MLTSFINKLKTMNKKNVIISSVIAWLVIVSGVYYAIANDDYTCYNYTESTSSCLSDQTICEPWTDWVRYCDWTNVTTYSVAWTYRCSFFEFNRISNNSWRWRWNLFSNNSRLNSEYSVNWTCRVKYTDTQTPQVIGWGIE